MELFYLDKQSHKSKWHLVLTTSFGLLASSYCLVLPAQHLESIGTQLNINDPKTFLSRLNSLHFFLNSILPFYSGWLRDNYGDRFSLMFQNSLCVIGQLIVTISFMLQSSVAFIIGRIILGWGIESLLIIITSFICSYYKFTYLTFVLGIFQFIYTLGFVLCIWFAPQVGSIGAQNSIAMLLTLLGLLMALVARDIDQNTQSELMGKGPLYFKYSQIRQLSQFQQQSLEGEQIPIDTEKNHLQDNDRISQVSQIKSEQVELSFFQNHFGFSDKHLYPSIYWYMLLFYTLVSISVLVLVDYAQDFLYEKWLNNIDNGQELAWKLVTIMWLFSGLITPLLGFVIDKYGQRSSLTIFSGLMGVWAHILVLLKSPFEGLLLLGISFALSYTTVWSGVLYLTHPQTYGRSLSLFVCFQNFGIAVIPLICHFFEEITSAKLITESFLLLLAIIATIVSTLVYLENKKYVNLFDRGMEVISEILIQSSSKIQSKNKI